MGIKISALTSGNSVNGDDKYPAVQGGSTKKFSPSQMASYILNTFSSLSLGGVVRTVKAAIDAIATTVASHTTLLGDSTMGTTATTVTGAIAEHEGDITTLNSKYEFVTYNGNLGALSAGASGYITASVTIPTGYRTTGITSIAKQHIAGAAGLTIMANMPRNNTGTVTFYPSYYTPTSVASGNADFQKAWLLYNVF